MEFNPDVVLRSKRLILRYLNVKDTHDIFININHDKDVLEYFIDKYVEEESEMTLNKTIEFCKENHRYLFAIELAETHEVIGMILQCSTPDRVFTTSEIGFAIGKKYWSNGYATEALETVMSYLFSIGVHKIVVSHIVGNIASKRVIEKCHMIYEGGRVDEVFYHDQYYAVDYYYLINPDKNK